MPRIPDILLKAVVFLYPDEHSANSGDGIGGTGFLVSVKNPATHARTTFLITNQHVAGRPLVAKGNVVRGTAVAGEAAILIEEASWTYHPDGDDVAVREFPVPDHWDALPLMWENVLPTAARLAELNVGIGDDVVMIGRFLSSAERHSVRPLARFGSIALMPSTEIVDGRGFKVEAFLVEMRSASGFSGSPVFIRVGAGSDRANGTMMPFNSQQIGVLGMNTGHISNQSRILDTSTKDRIDEPWEVHQNSGISIVTPYTKINDTIKVTLERRR